METIITTLEKFEEDGLTIEALSRPDPRGGDCYIITIKDDKYQDFSWMVPTGSELAVRKHVQTIADTYRSLGRLK